MAQVTVRYVNPPREGKTNGSIRLMDNTYISVPPALLPLFAGTEGQTIEVATKSFQGSSGQTIITAESGPGGVRVPMPPRPAGGYPPKPAPAAAPAAAPRSPEVDKHIFVTGIVGRAMGSGKFAASEIRVLVQAALEGWDLYNKPPLPAVPKPLPVLAPGLDQDGDPGPQLQ